MQERGRWRKGGIQDRRDAAQKGYRTDARRGEIQDRYDAGK